MPERTTTTLETAESSFLNLLSGWMQQGIENFFAVQRVLVDLAVRQNAAAMQIVRERLADPAFCPMALVSEFVGEGMTNFIEGQKLLLELAHRENELILNAVKDRVGISTTAVAMTEVTRRGLNTFIEMHQEFLKSADKQTHAWLDAVEKGKGYDGEHFVEFARDAMENFVHAQKRFLALVAEEASRVTSRKDGAHKPKGEDLSTLAEEATEYFIEAQKKLMDVAGKQVSTNLKATGKALEMLKPFPFMPLPDLTRQGMKRFVEAEQTLIDSVMKRKPETKATSKRRRPRKRPVRLAKARAATVKA
jgi:hypothetical protein